jgi:hypothetical protein
MNKKLALFAAIAVIAMPITPAFAQVSTPTTTQTTPQASGQMMRNGIAAQRQENQANRADLKQQAQTGKTAMAEKRLEFQNNKEIMTQDRCKNIEEKIATRVGRYENNGQMIQSVYGNMQARLARLLERLNTAGADTTKLTADLATLNIKIEKLKADQATFMATLKDSQTFVCGKSEGEFKGKLDEARKVPELLKQDRQDIRNFFQTTIRVDLQEIRNALGLKKEAATLGANKAPQTETQTKPESIQ